MSAGLSIRWGLIRFLVTLAEKRWREQQRWYSCPALTVRRSSSGHYSQYFPGGLNQSWLPIRHPVPTITRTC
jgi:hypothetical protein